MVTTHDDLVELVAEVVDRFRHFVEEQRGWSLLWNDDRTAKPEAAAQLLFLCLRQPYLRQFNVELDREVELGRGPVEAFIVTKEHRRFTEFANAVRKEKTIGICHGAAGVGKTNSARRYAWADPIS